MKSAIISRTIIINLAIILLIGFIQIQAQTTKTIKINSSAENLSETQKAAIENIVRDYLLKNPSIIREALQALQVQEANEKQELAASNLKRLNKEIFGDPNSPTAGNKDADVSIVAFFDYNCHYCKQSLPELNNLLTKDPSLKVIYKEFPILSPTSQLAAKAALAADRQGKYLEFHNALLSAEMINDEVIKNISDQLGLNYDTLQKDMNDEKINEALSNNYNLAAALNIQGTPAYIIGTQLIPGAIDINSLTNIVKAEREKLSTAKNTAAISLAQ